MNRGAGWGRRLAAVLGLGLVAGVYFAGMRELTLDFMDEGQIIYPAWRTALGEWPYIAYAHLYGPSLFFLNGAALRLFGHDLDVLRLVMVVVRTLTVVLGYATARRLAPPLPALLAAGMVAIVWGTPIWLFNTPYAAFYATPACLAGLLVLLGPRTAARAAAAGLLFGLAMTFKQTQGVFALLAAALWIVVEREHDPAPASMPSRSLVGAARLARLGGIAAIGAVVVAYTAGHLASPSTWWTLLPMAVAVAAVAGHELATRPAPSVVRASVRRTVALAGGFALPLLAYGALYASRGALGALVDNTLRTWPARIVWFAPLPGLAWPQAALGGLVLLSFAVVWLWRRWQPSPPRWMPLAAAGLLAAIAAAVHPLWRRSLGHLGVYGLAAWLPYVLLGLRGAALLRGRDPTRASARRLFWLASASGVLQLYPSADMPHALLTLPLHVPLLADAYARFFEGAADAAPARLRRVAAAGLVVAWTAALAVPIFSWRMRLHALAAPTPFPQARALTLMGLKIRQAHALAERLVPERGAGRQLLVLSNEQSLYFLLGMRSALQEDEFLLFLIGSGFVDPDHPLRPGEEERMLARLEAVRPLVVDYRGSPASARLASALPRLMARIADCPLVAEEGRYRVRSCGG